MASSGEEGELFLIIFNYIGLGFLSPVFRFLHRYLASLGLNSGIIIAVFVTLFITYRVVVDCFMVTVEIIGDDLGRAVQHLVSEKVTSSKHMRATIEKQEIEVATKKLDEFASFTSPTQRLVLRPLSDRWFFADYMPFKIHVRQTTQRAYHIESEKIVYSLTCFGASAEPIKRILKASLDHILEPESNKVRIMLPKSDPLMRWGTKSLRARRATDTLAMDSKALEYLFADIDRYLRPDSNQRYQARGTPYRRGYLLYGPPGTGKTTLIHIIASKFRLPIYCLSLSARRMSDDSLISLTTGMEERGILLIEDIDSSGLGRTSSDLTHGVTLGGYLNATDGLYAPEGHMLFITSNRPELLDPAITRPGRIDYKIRLDNASSLQAEQLFRYSYSSDTNKDINSMARTFAEKIPEHEFSPAEIEQYLIKDEHQESPARAIAGISAWVAEHQQGAEDSVWKGGKVK